MKYEKMTGTSCHRHLRGKDTDKVWRALLKQKGNRVTFNEVHRLEVLNE